MKQSANTPNVLGDEIKKRLVQLGLSQRELARRIGISRQTVHNVIHMPHWGFTEETFSALDYGLKWRAGTARAFHQGNVRARDEVGAMSIEERINEYLATILERLREMDIDQLEREVIMLEEEADRTSCGDSESRRLIDAQIARLVDALSHRSNGLRSGAR
jgi:transcriptional regulator with XRE-family HTH domain